jgi:eukaryotic-like serine/threonine-protein kinase
MSDPNFKAAAGAQPGDVLAGKYRIERILGRGGMGIVVEATHLQLEDRVAIKFLLPEALGNPEAVSRFLREARAAVKIKNEHVARVSDVGTLETGAPYMVMEYLEGSDLGDRIHQKGALPVEDAVELVLQACEALAEAHAHRIVHRDLKPSNLFLVRRADGTPAVKVLDFGISKVQNKAGSDSDLGMTKTQAIMGSPLYMSPEQLASSRDVDQRTDIWALGVILYESLAGRVPFEAETMVQLCQMVMSQPPPSLRSLRADIPEGLQKVVLRCLEKDRHGRYANVAALGNALAPFAPRRARNSVERISKVIEAAGLGSEQPAALDATPPSVPQSAAVTMAAWGDTGAPKKRSAGLFVVVGVLLLAGVAVAISLRGGSAVSDPAPSSAAVAPASPKPAAVTAEVGPEIRPAEALPAIAAPPSPSIAASAPAPLRSGARAPKARAPVSKPVAAKPPEAAQAPAPAAKKPADLYLDRK